MRCSKDYKVELGEGLGDAVVEQGCKGECNRDEAEG